MQPQRPSAYASQQPGQYDPQGVPLPVVGQPQGFSSPFLAQQQGVSFQTLAPVSSQSPYYGMAAGPSATAVSQRPSRGSIKRQKVFEILVEKPVIVHKYVDVPEEIIIEKPVERYIEQEVIIEKYVEVPVERVVETEVEVVREELREFVVEKEVEYERVIEIPVEKYVEVPIDIVREVEVKVPVMVDRVIDRTILKPIETRVLENPVYVERPVVQDRYVDKVVEVPVDRVVERVQERVVNKDVYREVEVVIPVDKYVDRTVERPVDVYMDKVITREVEVPVYVDKYVDRPYEVVREQVRQVPVEVVRENRVTIAVDRVVEIPVERVVEVPVRQETRREVVYESVVETPVFDTAVVDVPVPVYIDRPVPVVGDIEQPIERVVDRIVEVPFGRVIERPVIQEINVDIFRITEVPSQVRETTVDIPVGTERYVEVPIEEVIERPITIQKIIERPVIIPRYIDRFVDKVVDVRVEVVVPKCIEVPRTIEHDKLVDITTRVQRVHFNQRAQSVPIGTVLKRSVISAVQKQRFYESSVQLANVVVENEKLKAEMQSLRERSRSVPHLGGVGASVQENERLRRVIFELEQSLRVKEEERMRLRSTAVVSTDLGVTTLTDSSDVPRMLEHIRRVKAENDKLRSIMARGSFSQSKVQVGSRVVRTDVIREGPVQSMTYGAGYTSLPTVVQGTTFTGTDTIRRSVQGNTLYAAPAPVTYTRTSGTHSAQTLVNPSAPIVRSSSTSVQQNVVRTSGGYYSRSNTPAIYRDQTQIVQPGVYRS
jgi:hypothetical protein